MLGLAPAWLLPGMSAWALLPAWVGAGLGAENCRALHWACGLVLLQTFVRGAQVGTKITYLSYPFSKELCVDSTQQSSEVG